ncbi:MFS transporter [Streptomyces sp. NPDC003327]
MLSVLRNRTYRRLLTAQVVALLGTGLATVALGLLAHDLAGPDATAVLGTALAVKMAAYVTVPPLVGAVADRVPRRALLVTADLVRLAAALALPFVTQVWQTYAVIVLLQAASAAFTPTFQATVPDVLPDEREYTAALSLSRLAYDTESLLSPLLAAALLTLVPYDGLFTGTAAGFLVSALLVLSVRLPAVPAPASTAEAPTGPAATAAAGGARGAGPRVNAPRAKAPRAKALFGIRLFLGTPRLRALLALELAVAAAGATVLVGTVGLVRHTLHRPATDVALALGAYGAGSMVLALLLPRLLDRFADRALMLPAAFVLPGALALLALGLAVGPGAWSWPALLALWCLLGAATSAVLTPAGRLLRRSADAADLPAAFAARFSLAHGCWLLTYPLAGWLSARPGPAASAVVLAAVAMLATVAAARLWPRRDPVTLEHPHPDLPADHPHLAGTGARHAHAFHIDALHHRWPTRVRTRPGV